MRRREFISFLGGVAATWPFAAAAQQRGKLPTIGFLGSATPAAWAPWTAAFLQRLPWLLFGLYAGVVADRLNRRAIVITTGLVRVAILLFLTAAIKIRGKAEILTDVGRVESGS